VILKSWPWSDPVEVGEELKDGRSRTGDPRVVGVIRRDPVWFLADSKSTIGWREASLDTRATVIQRWQTAHKLAISLTTRHLDSNLLRP